MIGLHLMEVSLVRRITKLVGWGGGTCRLGSRCHMATDLAVSARIVVLQRHNDLSIIIIPQSDLPAEQGQACRRRLL